MLAAQAPRDTPQRMEPQLLTWGYCPCCWGDPFDGHEDPRLCETCAEQQAEVKRQADLEAHWADVADEREIDRCYYGRD